MPKPKKIQRRSKHKALQNLPNNLRFYIVVSALGLSLLLASWLRLHISSDQLFYIRMQQAFGFVSLLYWYAALVISPLSKVLGKEGRMQYVIFARRAIGVVAAYFAFLHAAIAFWAQIGGVHGLAFLPDRFKWSLGFGLIGLIILGAMAATSFDKIIRHMTLRRWKWLHRLGYIGGVLVLLHVWMIGTHVASANFQTVIVLMLIFLSWLEAFRLAQIICKKHKKLRHKQQLVMLLLWSISLLLLLGVPKTVKNYHQEHHGSGHAAH